MPMPRLNCADKFTNSCRKLYTENGLYYSRIIDCIYVLVVHEDVREESPGLLFPVWDKAHVFGEIFITSHVQHGEHHHNARCDYHSFWGWVIVVLHRGIFVQLRTSRYGIFHTPVARKFIL